MRFTAVRVILAVAFFAAAIVSRNQARDAVRVADLHERLVTLRHAPVADESVPSASWFLLVPGSLPREASIDQTKMAYWRLDYASLSDPVSVSTASEQESLTPEALFFAANARFRAVDITGGNRTSAVAQLDGVINVYGDVLRAAPGHLDAAFNFEYASRLRDTIARGRPNESVPLSPTDPIPSPDLQMGPTIHGQPGGPPPEIPGSRFRTIAPMLDDEREESDPGSGVAPRRRG